MIVWLASYPRSGNTLLREILWQTMGLRSTSDDKLNIPVSGSFREAAGDVEYAGTWEDFYQRAAASAERHLIKTHRPPRDGAKAIYVVRDGRSSCDSYFHYQKSYFPAAHTTLADVIVGDVAFGDWSAHYAAWDTRANTWVVRFENLVSAGPDLLARIAEFVGYRGEIRAWQNPMAQLHKHDPAFFRRGDAKWQAPTHWTPGVNALFWACHGPLMERLGYGQTTAEVGAEALAVATELSALIKAGIGHRTMLQEACDQRLALVERLHEEGQTLLGIRDDQQRELSELRRELAGMRQMA